MWSTSRLLRFWISRCLLFMLTLSAVLEGNDRTTVELGWARSINIGRSPCVVRWALMSLIAFRIWHIVRCANEWGVVDDRSTADAIAFLPFPYYSSLNTNCPAILCLSQCLFTVCAHQWVRAKTAWPPWSRNICVNQGSRSFLWP